MSPDRFDKLEEAREGLPENLKSAISNIDRFEHLEIGQTGAAAAAQTPPPAQPASEERILCSHCGQSNEKERDLCWACFKPLKLVPLDTPPKEEQELTLVLDGLTYRSSDPDLPEDIRVLMDRIRKEGYSQQLVVDWRSWRATRHAPMPGQREFEEPPARDAHVEAFRGNRVSVIRIDGKVYLSDDKDLSPEFKQLFGYIDTHGVTPELLQYLRRFGDRVKFRPHTTAAPSDGDIAFWDQVHSSASQPGSENSGEIRTLPSFWDAMRNLVSGLFKVR